MARLSRDTTCACQIVAGQYGPELQIRVRLPEARIENEGMKVVLVDEKITVEDTIIIGDVQVHPVMSLSLAAEVPATQREGFKKRRALEAAREGSPILY